MKQIKAKIVENKKIAENFYKMRIESPYLAKNTKPGQFFEVKCSGSNEPFLRRPLCVHSISKNCVEMLYEVVGKGTELLSRRKRGEYLDVIGPLGNGFFVQRTAYSVQRSAILIAGGVGIAPLVALAEELNKKSIKTTVIIGAKTKLHLLCEKELASLGCAVEVTTEDGSKGIKGLATDLLRSTQYDIRSTIYACGPTDMLKAVAKIAADKRIPCQVSLEERMACGVGVCLGCPVKVRTAYSVQRTALTQYASRSTQYEYKMVCKDGPVFNSEEIEWQH